MEWMLLPLKRYAEFSGRSRRKEYWMFFLFTLIVGFVLGALDAVLGLKLGGGSSGTGVLGGLFNLAMLVPSIAVGVRRLHDTDRSGWMLLMPAAVGIVGGVIGFLVGGWSWAAILGGGAAVVGGIVLIVFYCQDGTQGPNRFGADPKNPEGDLAEVFG